MFKRRLYWKPYGLLFKGREGRKIDATGTAGMKKEFCYLSLGED